MPRRPGRPSCGPRATTATVVFRHTGDGRRAVLRYAYLAAVILTINVVAMDALVIGVGIPLLLAKVVVEGVLFLLT